MKYSNSRRSNRRTKAGFWKPTGKTIKVKAKRNKEVIGTKKTLVFYKSASPKAERTAWIIHEYEVFVSDSRLSNLVSANYYYYLCNLVTLCLKSSLFCNSRDLSLLAKTLVNC